MAPGRPSGVSSGGTSVSTDASAGDMMMDDANPDAVLAAIKAHFSLAAVISILPAHMGNISAKVSSIFTGSSLSGTFTIKSLPSFFNTLRVDIIFFSLRELSELDLRSSHLYLYF